MSRHSHALAAALALSLATVAPGLTAQSAPAVADTDVQRYSDKQLDNLVSPIALYPDALLAQVLVASTFPDQVEEAARFVRANGTDGIDDEEWDVSVKSVAHYPSALNMMADKADWMATLGRAYAFQSSDVMAAVQRMRALAAQHGNLVSTSQQQVVHENNNYMIVPAEPRVIYVPVYDPVVIYTRPIFTVGFSTRFWSFGVGFPIGSWLTYDCDWRGRVVYYNGWHDRYYGWHGGWRSRSRPFIQITNIYVNQRYTNVYVNRDVRRRHIDYGRVDRYPRVHRDTWFGNGRGYARDDDRRDHDRGGHDIVRTARPRDNGGYATPDGYRRASGNTNETRNVGDRSRNTERWGDNDSRSVNIGDNSSGGRVGAMPVPPRTRDNGESEKRARPVERTPVITDFPRNPRTVDRTPVLEAPRTPSRPPVMESPRPPREVSRPGAQTTRPQRIDSDRMTRARSAPPTVRPESRSAPQSVRPQTRSAPQSVRPPSARSGGSSPRVSSPRPTTQRSGSADAGGRTAARRGN